MNNTRRKEIKKVIYSLRAAIEELEYIKSDEEDALDNIPENLTESEIAYGIEGAIDELEDAISDIELVISTLEDI